MAEKPQQKSKKKPKLRYVREDWVFDWKRPEATPISTWFSILLVGAIFVFAVLSLRVKLVEPVDLDAPQASVIHLDGKDWSQALVMEARAKGPFPSRFDPDDWSGTAGMRLLVNQASQPRLKPHQPRLLPFPEAELKPPRMARRGEPVLPDRVGQADGDLGVEGLRLMPVLTAIDGIKPGELPQALPAWDDPVTDVLASRPWKFLVELEDSGRVRECVALAGGNELSPKELTNWLRGVVFRTEAREGGRRWVAVAIEFQNQTQ